MSAFVYDETVTRKVLTPCCETEMSLAYRPFVHAGYPRRTDRTFEVWNLRCDGCGAEHKVGVFVRLRREKAEGLWTTYGRLYGAPVWFGRRTDEQEKD